MAIFSRTDGIILDVDGTLWDSTGIVAQAWTRAVKENGCPERIITAEELRREFGKPMDEIAKDLLPELTEAKRRNVMEACCAYEHEYLCADPCRICYPGVEDTIRNLSGRTGIFIVSNCQAGYIELFLEKTGLGICIRDYECFGNNGCGKAENIRLLVRRNHLQSPFYVGDTQGDAKAAAAAQIPFVFAAYGFGRADRMDAQIRQFSDLIPLIDE